MIALRRIVSAVFMVAAVCCLFLAGPNSAGTEASAPIPAQIQSGKSAFISYAGIDSTLIHSEIAKFTGSENGYYDQFYGEIKTWGRYQMATTPAEADLVFEISMRSAPGNPQLRLRVLDPKTGVVLWAFSEETQRTSKEFNKALTRLLNDLKLVATPSSATQNPNR